MSLQITEGGLVVRAPFSAPAASVERFIKEHEGWIEKKRAEMKKRRAAADALPPLTDKDIKELADKALKYIPGRVKFYAEKLGVSYGRITIRNQRTRWGSCFSKKNLNFNCLLMLTPPEVIDSVVVHELCHLRHMDHSPSFYAEVKRAYPEYDRWNAWLRKNGKILLMRMKNGET